MLIFTASEAEPPETATAVEVVRHEGVVDLGDALRHLRQESGIRALLCEGGPRLHAELQAAGLVDDLFLTIAPKLAGGEAPRIIEGELPGVAELELAWLLEEDGELFARYSGAERRPLAFRPDPEERTTMDFKPSPQVETLRERILDFMDEHDLPAGAGDHGGARRRGRRPASPTRRSWSRSASGRRSEGLWNLFMPDERFGPGPHQLGVRAALRGDGPQPGGGADGLQLLGARHRQHGDPRRARHRGAARALARAAARGPDPLLLLDDRARGLRLGPDRCCRRARCATATSG